MLTLSIVIPALNEQDHLARLLEQLHAQQSVRLDIIVVDGGSSDRTLEVARQFAVTIESCAKGRGKQMNHGAKCAVYPLILFLHADSRLSDPYLLYNAIQCFQTQLTQQGTQRLAGHFPLRFDQTGDNHPLAYGYLEEKTRQNRLYTINGDQGLMILSAYFNELGCFNEDLHFLEDQFISRLIFETGTWLTLPGHLHTSARRFEQEGWYQRYLLMGLIMVFFQTGELSFFSHAKDAYRTQNQTRQLRITPFIAITARIIFKNRSIRSFFVLFAGIGTFCRHNLWQIFFWIDFMINQRQQHPIARPGKALGFYDRWINPILTNRVADTIIAAIVFSLFFLVVTPLIWIIETIKR